MPSIKQKVLYQTDDIEAVVGGVVGTGENQYVFTYTRHKGLLPKGTPVTFSMKYWKGDTVPLNGEVVTVSGVKMYAKGWRAFNARPISPATSNKSEVTRE